MTEGVEDTGLGCEMFGEEIPISKTSWNRFLQERPRTGQNSSIQETKTSFYEHSIHLTYPRAHRGVTEMVPSFETNDLECISYCWISHGHWGQEQSRESITEIESEQKFLLMYVWKKAKGWTYQTIVIRWLRLIFLLAYLIHFNLFHYVPLVFLIHPPCFRIFPVACRKSFFFISTILVFSSASVFFFFENTIFDFIGRYWRLSKCCYGEGIGMERFIWWLELEEVGRSEFGSVCIAGWEPVIE